MNRASNFINQKLTKTKEEKDRFTIIIEHFSICLLIIDITMRQSIFMDLEELKRTIKQLDLININVTLSNKRKIHILFKCICGTFIKVKCILYHKRNLDTFKNDLKNKNNVL
jgi:hypothetical protein